MILFLDENLPPGVARALEDLGECEAHHLTDHLSRGVRDEEVFAFLATKPGWYLLTQDEKIRRRPHELAALKAAGVGAFFLTGSAVRDRRELMMFILAKLPLMREVAARERPPFIFGIPDRGKPDKLA